MKLDNEFATDLTSKDRNVALAAARHIIDNSDMAAWTCFVQNSDNIFDFIKQNIGKYFAEVIDEDNYMNLFNLFKIHSFDWDECLIQILLRFSYLNYDLNEKMLDLIQNGTEDEKAYAAKFFSFLPNEKANYYLFEAYSVNYEPLKYNAARALGDSSDMYSYDYYLNKLLAEDDWEKVDAAQFLQWYGNKKAFEPLLKAMSSSAMPEHIAGDIAMLVNISEYFNSSNALYKELSLDCYQYLIDSLAEIWPLSTILDFEIYDCVQELISLFNSTESNNLKSRYAALLLKTRYQFETFCNNDEYKFNEDKKTLQVLDDIFELLLEGGKNFWDSCVSVLGQELQSNNDNRIIYAAEIISALNINSYLSQIKDMLTNLEYSEDVIFKLALTLDTFKDFEGLNKDAILNKLEDINKKMVIQQAFAIA